jgi:hypothetical protein
MDDNKNNRPSPLTRIELRTVLKRILIRILSFLCRDDQPQQITHSHALQSAVDLVNTHLVRVVALNDNKIQIWNYHDELSAKTLGRKSAFTQDPPMEIGCHPPQLTTCTRCRHKNTEGPESPKSE